MDISFYLKIFRNAADKIDRSAMARKQLEIATGLYGDSVFLKLYKQSWASPSEDPLTAKSRIFFSIWISDSDIAEKKLRYNIHALKLRQLKGYSIASRKFAESFRGDFSEFEPQWPNVSVNYGPLTLMQGWIAFNPEQYRKISWRLLTTFLS